MITKVAAGLLEKSLDQISEELISALAEGKQTGIAPAVSSLCEFISEMKEDVNALEKRATGLGGTVLHMIRQISNLSYDEIGATLTYMRHTLPAGAPDVHVIQEHLNRICTAKSKHGFVDVEYRIFLEYFQAFKSEKPIEERIEEFNSVVSTVKEAYKRGHRKLAIITKAVDGSWDSYLSFYLRHHAEYGVALHYKALEEKYGISIDKVELILERYLVPETAKAKPPK